MDAANNLIMDVQGERSHLAAGSYRVVAWIESHDPFDGMACSDVLLEVPGVGYVAAARSVDLEAVAMYGAYEDESEEMNLGKASVLGPQAAADWLRARGEPLSPALKRALRGKDLSASSGNAARPPRRKERHAEPRSPDRQLTPRMREILRVLAKAKTRPSGKMKARTVGIRIGSWDTAKKRLPQLRDMGLVGHGDTYYWLTLEGQQEIDRGG